VNLVAGADSGESRLRRVRDRLHDERLDGLLVSHLPNIRYLSGFTGSSALLLVEPGVATLFTDFRYEIQAREEIGPGVALAIINDGLFDELALRLEEELPGRRIGFEPAAITVRDRQELGARCDTVVWDAAGAPVEELRTVKDSGELARCRSRIPTAKSRVGFSPFRADRRIRSQVGAATRATGRPITACRRSGAAGLRGQGRWVLL